VALSSRSARTISADADDVADAASRAPVLGAARRGLSGAAALK
jgi:hypothetical protein